MRTLLVAVVFAMSAVALGCATTQQAAKNDRVPYPREKGKPVTIPVLGASYTFPANFDITHYVDKPGIFGVEIVDRITGCEAVMNFETVAQTSAITAFTNNKIEEVKNRAVGNNLNVSVATESFTALKKNGRILVASVSSKTDPNDVYAYSQFELSIPEETLVFHGDVECAQEPLRAKTFEVAKAVFNSQTR